jgi:hypothetical protein
MPTGREPYWGSAKIDLDRVGAYTEGSVASEDSVAPGVVVSRSESPGKRPTLGISLGSNRNRRGTYILDGAFIDARIVEVTPGGFRGPWEASVGPTTYRAAGFFCAERQLNR